ncbi:MAG: sensor histidine kinase [Endozoicomonas sp.]
MPPNVPSSSTNEDFFLPDLCSPRAVFMLVLVSELFVLTQVLALSGPDVFNWNRLATVSLFVQWISLCSAAVLCRLRPIIKNLPLPVATTLCLTTVILITLVFTLTAQWFLWRDAFLIVFPDWQQLVRHALVALIITAMLLRYFYVQQEASKQQQASLNARYDALQARIRPHFLFNSMNIIASLIQIDPDKAEQAVEDLSDLFRSSLQENGNSIAIGREIELCKRYLRIEAHRLGERLQSEWQIAELPQNLHIPPLTLQPLVENAVYHGIQPLEKGGTVSVDITLDNDNVCIRVRNPLPDVTRFSGQESRGNQLALENIRSRLKMLYGHRALVETRTSENDGIQEFETTIRYPCNDRTS